MIPSDITHTAIRRYVDNARRTHRIAVWFANQARRYSSAVYGTHADKLRKEAWDFLADARRIKAAASMGEAA